MINITRLFIAAFFTVSATLSTAQQLKVPAGSPTQWVKQAFALSDITLEYSRPSVKGRVIYGELVPFGKIWRTGANASTKITFGEDVKVEGTPLKAGTYSVYTIPNKDSWEVLFNKDLTLGGNVASYKTEEEVLRIKVKPTTLNNVVETFTINFADLKATSVNIELLWEKTRVAFAVTSEIDATIVKNIDAALSVDSRPYFQAAGYYYDNNKDLNKALEWINKAIEQNPKAFYMYALKGKIQLKLKDQKGALESANKTIELAKEAKNEDYVKIGEKLALDAKAK